MREVKGSSKTLINDFSLKSAYSKSSNSLKTVCGIFLVFLRSLFINNFFFNFRNRKITKVLNILRSIYF